MDLAWETGKTLRGKARPVALGWDGGKGNAGQYDPSSGPVGSHTARAGLAGRNKQFPQARPMAGRFGGAGLRQVSCSSSWGKKEKM